MPRSGFINEMLQDMSDEVRTRTHAHACNTAQRECEFIHAFVLILIVSQLEQSIIHLIDHPEIEVRTALLPLLCSHRFDFSDDVLLVPTLRPLPFALC